MKLQRSKGVGISLPKELMAQIDSERGDISRSRFLLRLIEGSAGKRKDVTENDQLNEGSKTLVSRLNRLEHRR
jgi:metal-responsive CopG/Arc/MetJ family transcriptional regulator